MPGQNVVCLYVWTKNYRKSQELTEKEKQKNIVLYITLNQILIERLMTIDRKNTKISAVSDFYERMERS